MKVLHVAEKPDAAKKIAAILSNGGSQRRNSHSKYNPIFSFPCTFPPTGEKCEFIVTSLIGHLIDNDIEEKFRKWFTCPDKNILDQNLVKIDNFVRKDIEGIAKNLRQESKFCDHLVLWLDCDREGENIAFEVVDVVKKENPRKWNENKIWRAKFSDFTPRAINHAIENLARPNQQESMAVDARKEIDLRIGAAYTRYQTIHLQRKFNLAGANSNNENQKGLVVSYGPCQFPTLGFVVERYLRAQNFVPEKNWTIKVNHMFPNPNAANAIDGVSNDDAQEQEDDEDGDKKGKKKRKNDPKSSKKNFSKNADDDLSITFDWVRGNLFDRLTTLVLYEGCVKSPTAKVIAMEKSKIKNYRPFPMNTVEMQKLASSILHMSAQQTMKVAEDLYNKGYISYPRTETNHYNLSTNELQHLIEEQKNNPSNGYNQYCNKLLTGDEFCYPKAGKSDDKAHPPIHPTKLPDISTLNNDEKRLYELISRHFLATMGKDGEGSRTKIEIEIANEIFVTNGVMIEAYHYLEIYIYSKWNGKVVPILIQNQTFVPDAILMQEGQTAKPHLLSETELISLMDKNGIGTDATIAQHIDTIQKRGYAVKQNNVFEPTNLGVALVRGYDVMGFELSKPNLRAKMEADMKLISEGKRTKEAVIKENLDMYKQVLGQIEQNIAKLDVEFSKYFPLLSNNNNNNGFGGNPNQNLHPLFPVFNDDDNNNNDGGGGGGGGGGGFFGNAPAESSTSPRQTTQNQHQNQNQNQTQNQNQNLRPAQPAQGEDFVRNCPKCNNPMYFKSTKTGKKVISCSGYRSSNCKYSFWFNLDPKSAKVLKSKKCLNCSKTGKGNEVHLMKLTFDPEKLPIGLESPYSCCVFCDSNASKIGNVSG